MDELVIIMHSVRVVFLFFFFFFFFGRIAKPRIRIISLSDRYDIMKK